MLNKLYRKLWLRLNKKAPRKIDTISILSTWILPGAVLGIFVHMAMEHFSTSVWEGLVVLGGGLVFTGFMFIYVYLATKKILNIDKIHAAVVDEWRETKRKYEEEG